LAKTTNSAAVQRNSPAQLNRGPVIHLFEANFPGKKLDVEVSGSRVKARGGDLVRIKGKWIYVLWGRKGQGASKVLDEIHAREDGRWRRKKLPSEVGDRLPLGKKNSVLMRAGRYAPTSAKLYMGEFFFYLSPIPLGKQAVKELLARCKADTVDTFYPPIEKEFQKLHKAVADRAEADHQEEVARWEVNKREVESAIEELERLAEEQRQSGQPAEQTEQQVRELKGKIPERPIKEQLDSTEKVIVWQDIKPDKELAKKHKKTVLDRFDERGYVCVRAACFFDDEGELLTSSGGIKKMPTWHHVVVLQDPEQWAEDLHDNGVRLALDRWSDFRGDKDRFYRMSIAAWLAMELQSSPEKSLDKELIPVDAKMLEPTDFNYRGKEILDRMSWRNDRARSGFTQQSLRHDFKITEADRREVLSVNLDRSIQLGKSRGSNLKGDRKETSIPVHMLPAVNAAELYLGWEDLREGAYLRNLETQLGRLSQFLDRSRYEAYVKEHCFAASDAVALAEGTEAFKRAMKNSSRGDRHWEVILAGLSSFKMGRSFLAKLMKQAIGGSSDKPSPGHYCLPMGYVLDPATQVATWFKDKQTAIGKYKVGHGTAVKMLEAFIGGLANSGSIKSFGGYKRFVLTWYGTVSGRRLWDSWTGPATWKKLRRQVLAELPDKLGEAAEAEEKFGLTIKKYQDNMDARVGIGTLLDIVEAAFIVVSLAERLFRDDKPGAMDKAEFAADLIKLGQGALAAIEWNRKRRGLPTMSDTNPRLHKGLGIALNVVVSVIEIVSAIVSIGKAENWGTRVGYIGKAVGGIAGLVFGIARTLGMIAGPVGMLFAFALGFMAYVADWVIGHYSHLEWKRAAATSFLGNGEPIQLPKIKGSLLPGAAMVRKNYRRWLELYASFELEVYGHKLPGPAKRIVDSDGQVLQVMPAASAGTSKATTTPSGSLRIKLIFASVGRKDKITIKIRGTRKTEQFIRAPVTKQLLALPLHSREDKIAGFDLELVARGQKRFSCKWKPEQGSVGSTAAENLAGKTHLNIFGRKKDFKQRYEVQLVVTHAESESANEYTVHIRRENRVRIGGAGTAIKIPSNGGYVSANVEWPDGEDSTSASVNTDGEKIT